MGKRHRFMWPRRFCHRRLDIYVQACIKSHPNSSHPLQCRALELCFSVALERLPTAQNMSPGMEPPISNALMAALKRAQAHQRRGCPEQQQQPLLAVKVELEQLIISILDDPSVSRVMREASFSSPAVKATIEQSLNSSSSTVNSTSIGIGFRPPTVAPAAPPGRNLYLNPRLQQGSAVQPKRGEEVKRIIDILSRTKKRNPVLVGVSEPEALIKELLKKIENKELGDGPLNNVQVIHLEKDLPSDKVQVLTRLNELGDLVESRMRNMNSGVVLYLGDLKWLVELPVGFGVTSSGTAQHQVVTEAGRAAVMEMGKLLVRFGEGSIGRLWLIGTATCETYLKCQVYHPSMENDWDLQAVPIAARAPLPGMFPRLGANGILGSSLESLSPLKGFLTTTITPPRRASENLDPVQRVSRCPQCMQNYEQEVAGIKDDFEKSAFESKSEAVRPALPQWLQNAKANNGDVQTIDQTQNKNQEAILKKKTQELQKKWHDVCLHSHPNFHQQNISCERIAPTTLSMTSLYSPNLLGRQPLQPKLQLNRSLGGTLQLNPNPIPSQPSERMVTPLGSPVRTELVLGKTKVADTTPEQTHEGRIKDFLGCVPSEQQNMIHELQSSKPLGTLDADSFKKLRKGLTEKVWWQPDAASAVATTVTHCKLGNGKRRGTSSKGDIWLLFMGPDRVGKKKMASTLSELLCGSNPIMISLGSRHGDGESDVSLRGKTALDRIAEAVRRSPFSVIMLEDFDEADMIVRGSVKRAMERGRLVDSHGREISLGNIIFILSANWLPDNLKYLSNGITSDEEKFASLARGGWRLRLSLGEKTLKRRANWLLDADRSTKPRIEMGSGLSFDLNEAANVEDERGDGSHDSSDLTVEHEADRGLNNRLSSVTPTISHELLDGVDDAIVFKPVDLSPIRCNITSSITKKFSIIIGNGVTMEVQDEALENITSGVWLGRTGIEEWIEKVLVPSFLQLKEHLPVSDGDEAVVVRLESDGISDYQSCGDWLPTSVRVVAEV
ncbi:protein SUPPRESSOR OF MAX2 1 [Quillaja saponaria]|uniref:Protein SUPPRESSOR OF MAX2 1 n=1 Tax=Quillaja saponaria TaxID=32244 RepID=A0AAD7LCS2_QUISA|nr:protein SUPPRESSOR OF MAX2 1 [Quillaja saponaria]